jgi:hypothetical protein
LHRTVAGAWLVLFAAPALAAPGRLGGGGGVDVSLTRVILASLLGVTLAIFAALLLKRGGGRVDLSALRRGLPSLAVTRRIHVVESRRVSQHADLCLVRCDDTEYLILSSARRQQIVRTRDATAPIAGPARDKDTEA